MDCSAVEPRCKSKQINEQSMQDKFHVMKDIKDNITISGKCRKKIAYFNAEPYKGASVKLADSAHWEFPDVLFWQWLLQRHFLLQV